MVSPTSQQTRVYEWMRHNLPKDSPIVLNDVTSMYTVINVVGPKARLLMSELSNSDINLHTFTYKVSCIPVIYFYAVAKTFFLLKYNNIDLRSFLYILLCCIKIVLVKQISL